MRPPLRRRPQAAQGRPSQGHPPRPRSRKYLRPHVISTRGAQAKRYGDLVNDYRKLVTLRAGVGIAVLVVMGVLGAVMDGNGPDASTTAASSAAPVPEAQAAVEARNRLEVELYHNALPMVEPSDDVGSGPGPHINIPNPNLPNPDLPGHRRHLCHRRWC